MEGRTYQSVFVVSHKMLDGRVGDVLGAIEKEGFESNWALRNGTHSPVANGVCVAGVDVAEVGTSRCRHQQRIITLEGTLWATNEGEKLKALSTALEQLIYA